MHLIMIVSFAGRGAISSNPVMAIIMPDGSSPLQFALTADTSGGPPTNFTWTRDFATISDGGAFNISIAANGHEEADYQNSRYRSTLTVTGRLAGVYRYYVTNRATTGVRSNSFTVSGMLIICINLCHYFIY